MFPVILRIAAQPQSTLILSLLFAVLNVLDAHSTWMVLRPHYYSRERNPIARWIFRKLGPVRGIVVFKSVLLLFLATCIGFYAAYDAFTISIVMLGANLVFFVVVYHNYRMARRVRSSRF